MEWVETTAKTIEAAREAALDQLGVGADEAEFEVIEEPRPGLFGRLRGEARLRARVKPTPVRPKQERRRKGRGDKRDKGKGRGSSSGAGNGRSDDRTDPGTDDRTDDTADHSDAESGTSDRKDSGAEPRRRSTGNGGSQRRSRGGTQHKEQQQMTNEDSDVTPQEVGDAAVAFMDGLTDAFGVEAQSDLTVDGTELDVNVTGSELGLLVGSGGRTLNAIQDLARVAAQRRLGDHETRLRIDVAGYRERRQAALAKFAAEVAAQVRESGEARSLEPMSSADRKVVHDVLNEEDGVSSRSEGEDPDRRIIVVPD